MVHGARQRPGSLGSRQASRFAPIKIDDKNKADCLKASNGQPTPNEKWVINPKNKGIRDVFVWLANADPKNKKPLPIHPSLKDITVKEVVIDQPACHFVPHAIALREGRKLIVPTRSLLAQLQMVGRARHEKRRGQFRSPLAAA